MEQPWTTWGRPHRVQGVTSTRSTYYYYFYNYNFYNLNSYIYNHFYNYCFYNHNNYSSNNNNNNNTSTLYSSKWWQLQNQRPLNSSCLFTDCSHVLGIQNKEQK